MLVDQQADRRIHLQTGLGSTLPSRLSGDCLAGNQWQVCAERQPVDELPLVPAFEHLVDKEIPGVVVAHAAEGQAAAGGLRVPAKNAGSEMDVIKTQLPIPAVARKHAAGEAVDGGAVIPVRPQHAGQAVWRDGRRLGVKRGGSKLAQLAHLGGHRAAVKWDAALAHRDPGNRRKLNQRLQLEGGKIRSHGHAEGFDHDQDNG